jgi:hypothetical protein
MYEYWELRWNDTDRVKLNNSEKKPVPKPFCLPQIPYGLTGVRTRASVVRRRDLTAWAIWKATIGIDRWETWCDRVVLTELARNLVRWWVLVNTETSCRAPWKAEDLSANWVATSFQEIPCTMESDYFSHQTTNFINVVSLFGYCKDAAKLCSDTCNLEDRVQIVCIKRYLRKR